MELTFRPLSRAAALGGSLLGVVSTRRWLHAEKRRKDAEKRVHELEREINKTKRVREGLRERERRAEFVTLLSHEIRTPLTAILGYSEVMLDPQTARDRDVIDPYLEAIRTGAVELDRVLASLLDRYAESSDREQPEE